MTLLPGVSRGRVALVLAGDNERSAWQQKTYGRHASVARVPEILERQRIELAERLDARPGIVPIDWTPEIVDTDRHAVARIVERQKRADWARMVLAQEEALLTQKGLLDVPLTPGEANDISWLISKADEMPRVLPEPMMGHLEDLPPEVTARRSAIAIEIERCSQNPVTLEDAHRRQVARYRATRPATVRQRSHTLGVPQWVAVSGFVPEDAEEEAE